MQKLENAIEFYGAISHNKLHGLSVQVETNHVKLPAVVDGFASEGIIQFFFEDADNNDSGFNIYILDESNRAEVYHHCEGSKEGAGARRQPASIRHRTIVSPTAPASSTSTCRSSIRLSR
ncbi:class I adenylate cyclase [Klebsiella pneumoniae subsp. pneumoniae]|nr:class I adenylate cyclase [Klebsiella pneumoniae subsp. pneumoniae]